MTGSAQPQAANRAGLSDSPEETEVFGAAAERDVLAVVGWRSRVAGSCGKRLHQAAERRPGLEKRDVVPGVDEI